MHRKKKKVAFDAISTEKALGNKSPVAQKINGTNKTPTDIESRVAQRVNNIENKLAERREVNNGLIAALSQAKGTVIRGIVDSGAADHVTNKSVAPQVPIKKTPAVVVKTRWLMGEAFSTKDRRTCPATLQMEIQ